MQYDILAKMLLVGDYGSGKTSLMLRFSDNSYNESENHTIGVEFRIKNIEVQNKRVRLQIWDTAGSERFRSITMAYYRGTHGVFLVFDLSNKSSFDSLKSRLRQIREGTNNPNLPIILIGNKSDRVQERQVSQIEIDKFIEEQNIQYIQTSPKLNHNVDEAFHLLAKKMSLYLPQVPNAVPQQVNLRNRVLTQSLNSQKIDPQRQKMSCFQIIAPAAFLAMFVLLALVSQN